jgi:hypothetical protein
MSRYDKEEADMKDSPSAVRAIAFFEKFIQKFFLSQVLLPASTTQGWAAALERVRRDPQLSASSLQQARSLVAEGWPAQEAAFFWTGIVQDVVNVG